MTPEQRVQRIHHHEYVSLEGIHEHAERIVAFEELTTDMYAAFRRVLPEAHRLDFERRMSELGIEVNE